MGSGFDELSDRRWPLGEMEGPEGAEREEAELGEAFWGNGMRAVLNSCKLLSQPWLLVIGCCCCANIGV